MRHFCNMKNTHTKWIWQCFMISCGRLSLIAIALSVFLDLATKSFFYWTSGKYITTVLNKWSARGFSIPVWLIILLWIFILICIYGVYIKNMIPKRTYILIISWALGNLYDRILYNWVRDWIDIGFIPVFNIADICITLWVCIFMFYELKRAYGKYFL